MLPFTLTMDRPALEDWGSPEDIGATTLEGPIKVAGKLLFGALDAPVFGGLYSATKGKYRVVYPFHEHATLLDGELAITDEASGRTELYGPGDSWIIAKGTAVVWDIRSAKIAKSYLATTADI
ncbi:cupin domain-containing protein [Chelativorans intermedius]|uniref:Cupin domain-containing protein n=1 Tax=Chelativorans intermedius TaxID=515947 RepID=A0ABV6D5G7_9HYPH|nr:cupin domain-containing protein [Chelativorans intermedius]MCT8998811.1 cupin domain-containing protein [Chelativorans intermedius]